MDNMHKTLMSIQSDLKRIKQHVGCDEPDADDVGEVEEEEVPATPKVSPRRRGRHAKGMPFMKKGEE